MVTLSVSINQLPKTAVMLCCFALSLLCFGSFAHAQEEQEQEGTPTLKPVAIDGLPKTIGVGVTTSRGNLFYILEPKEQRTGRQIGSLLASGGIYQREPILFGTEERAALRFNHIAQSEDETRWAVANGVALFQTPGKAWQEIVLPKIRNQSGCRQWEKFGSPCQLIIPIGTTRAIVLQPRKDNSQLGTDVMAIERGTPKPLGEVALPGVALGPAVQDGLGGFWVLVRKSASQSRMSGYLHYTKDGQWLLWNNEEEAIPGTQLKGSTKFQVNPDVRKMAPDGQGGFFAIGKDRVLYRISPDGVASPFSSAQPVCQYCQPVSLAFDAQTQTLHMLSGQWRVGEAGQIENISPLVIYSFRASDGMLSYETQLPLPKESKQRLRNFYADVILSAGAGQTWVTAPNLIVHREGKDWVWFTNEARVEKVYVEKEKAKKQARANPALAALGSTGLWTMGLGGLFGSYYLAPRKTDAPGAVTYGILMPLIGSSAGWLTGSFFYPMLGEDQDASVVYLGTTGAIHTIAVGATTLFVGNLLGNALIEGENTTGTELEVIESGGLFSKASLGAFGGAAAGTVLSGLLTSMVIDYDPADTLDTWLGAFATAGLSSLGYFLFTPRWDDSNYREVPKMMQDP